MRAQTRRSLLIRRLEVWQHYSSADHTWRIFCYAGDELAVFYNDLALPIDRLDLFEDSVELLRIETDST